MKGLRATVAEAVKSRLRLITAEDLHLTNGIVEYSEPSPLNAQIMVKTEPDALPRYFRVKINESF